MMGHKTSHCIFDCNSRVSWLIFHILRRWIATKLCTEIEHVRTSFAFCNFFQIRPVARGR